MDSRADTGANLANSWAGVPEAFRAGTQPLPEPWEALFGPLRQGQPGEMFVVGQIGQSLDGRVATETGHSHYINGPEALAHLHRLRALVDAVVIGIGTALADDPQLTVRRVTGPQPARVVIDARGHYQTTTLTGLEFLPVEYQPAHWLADAAVTFYAPQRRFYVGAFINNAFNKTVVSSTFPTPFSLFEMGNLRPPRTYGIRAGVKF